MKISAENCENAVSDPSIVWSEGSLNAMDLVSGLLYAVVNDPLKFGKAVLEGFGGGIWDTIMAVPNAIKGLAGIVEDIWKNGAIATLQEKIDKLGETFSHLDEMAGEFWDDLCDGNPEVVGQIIGEQLANGLLTAVSAGAASGLKGCNFLTKIVLGKGCFVAGTLVTSNTGQRPIEALRMGNRAMTPGTTGTSNSDTEVHPSTHRSIALTMPEPGQGEAQIGLTRPLSWLAGNGLPQPTLGDTYVPEAESAPSVWLDVAELGLHGWATVKTIGPCPEIDPGPGRVITATIRHASAEVWHLQADLAPTASVTKSSSIPSTLAKASPLARTLRVAALGLLGFAAPLVASAASLASGLSVESLEAAPALQHFSHSAPASTVVIRPTGQHPFWSETRQAWVPARDLRVGEALRTQSGTAATVTLLERELGTQPVFNLEVENEHVYFVSEAGVLVHNACAKIGSKAGFANGLLPNLKRHGSKRHNDMIHQKMDDLISQGVTDLRKNQQQVDVHGNIVGYNRPDLQWIDAHGQKHNWEIDTTPQGMAGHQSQIPSNDPNAVNHFNPLPYF